MFSYLNEFFWKSYETSHKTHLHDSHLIHANSLKRIRFIQLLIHSIIPLYYLFTWRVSSYKYLTIIGMNFTFIFFILINLTSYFHISNRTYRRLFKRMTIIIFEVTFSLQLTITWFFWFFLYPVYETKYLFPDWTQFFIVGLYMHSGCWLGLCIDKFFNTLYFDRRHFAFLVLTMASYAIFTLVYESLYKTPIYPIMKWGSSESYVYMGIAVIMSVLPFYFGVWFSDFKAKSFSVNKKEKKVKTSSIESSKVAHKE